MGSHPRFIAYCRVSTTRQGRSGLGLEAQQKAVRQFVSSKGGEIIAPEYIEVETGKSNTRPELAKALLRCRKTGACLLVAKLDRLSRDAGFLMTLRNGGVDLAAADMPEANTLMFMVMAGMAQQEREYISARTKAGLAIAKARGSKLGGFRKDAADISKYQAQGVEANRLRAQRHSELVREDVESLAASGLSLRRIASHLNKAGILSPRQQAWSAQAVSNTISRLKISRPA